MISRQTKLRAQLSRIDKKKKADAATDKEAALTTRLGALVHQR
jgi:hypothetical protein